MYRKVNFQKKNKWFFLFSFAHDKHIYNINIFCLHELKKVKFTTQQTRIRVMGGASARQF